MYKITEKVALNPTVTKMVIEAPLIAKKAKPGQFIIVRPFEDSERIPLTVAGYDREKGTVDIIFQIVGGTTMELNSLEVGQSVHDFVGPLGRATEVEGLKKVCVVGGGVGCAIALPIARELHEQGCVVHSVVGFRSKDLLILEDEFKACSDELRIMTDDGSYGTKGVVTAALVALVAVIDVTADAGKTDRLAAELVDKADELGVHLADEHHLDNTHDVGGGVAQALDELDGDVELFEHLVDAGAAAVAEHGLHAEELEQHHVVHDGVLEFFVDHGVAAVLDDNDLTLILLKVRHCLHQSFDLVCDIAHGGASFKN